MDIKKICKAIVEILEEKYNTNFTIEIIEKNRQIIQRGGEKYDYNTRMA